MQSLLLALILFGFVQGCSGFLDAKPDVKLTTPEEIIDLRNILDNFTGFNQSRYPFLAEVLSDNYYLTDANWSSLVQESDRNFYLWKKEDSNVANYQLPYQAIYECNVVLEQLAKFERDEVNAKEYDTVKGSALFFRAVFHHALAQLYGLPYNESTASTDLGIPLRLSSNYTERTVRSTVNDTYKQIIEDLKTAVELLPTHEEIKSRPSKLAAYGYLAKIYLEMDDFSKAEYYATNLLDQNKSLMNFDQMVASGDTRIQRFNLEVIFHIKSLANASIMPQRAFVDTTLLSLYKEGDLRFSVLFGSNPNGSYMFKGDYDGGGGTSGFVFGGITTSETFLIRAECRARLGKFEGALADLNLLLSNRYKVEKFIPLVNMGSEALVKTVIEERRKELLFRGTRWSDIRRLNKDQALRIEAERNINGIRHILYENNPSLTVQIPFEVVNLTGIPQNP